MRRAVTMLGVAALVAVLPVGALAQQTVGQGRGGGSGSGQSTGQSGSQQGNQERQQELKRLREELKNLQGQLKQHEQALRAARQDQNKTLAEHESQIIKRLKDDITKVESRINALSRGR
jgi:peptidoglycan hydrolase CwlO-like protein